MAWGLVRLLLSGCTCESVGVAQWIFGFCLNFYYLLPSASAWGFEWGIYSRSVRMYVSVTLRNVNGMHFVHNTPSMEVTMVTCFLWIHSEIWNPSKISNNRNSNEIQNSTLKSILKSETQVKSRNIVHQDTLWRTPHPNCNHQPLEKIRGSSKTLTPWKFLCKLFLAWKFLNLRYWKWVGFTENSHTHNIVLHTVFYTQSFGLFCRTPGFYHLEYMLIMRAEEVKETGNWGLQSQANKFKICQQPFN